MLFNIDDGVVSFQSEHSNALQWRHNGRDGVSNHQPHDCLLKQLFRRRSKKTSKLRVTGLCVGNSPVTGEFPAQMASNAENVSIWWRHHGHWLKRKPRGHLNMKMPFCKYRDFQYKDWMVSGQSYLDNVIPILGKSNRLVACIHVSTVSNNEGIRYIWCASLIYRNR